MREMPRPVRLSLQARALKAKVDAKADKKLGESKGKRK